MNTSSKLKRVKTRRVQIGQVAIGGKEPIAIQSMTNTSTRDIKKTVAQINQLAQAGCDLVRVAVPDTPSAHALSKIKARSPLPVIADIHFDYRLALSAIENGADKIRINPGNIGGTKKIKKIVIAAKKNHVPIRLGINAGSLEQRLLKKYQHPTAAAMVESALDHIKIMEKLNFHDLVISLKHHDVLTVIKAYRLISPKTDYPLHLGVTEAGPFLPGTVKAAIAFGSLLEQGIGDTIRVSLSDDPVKEIQVGLKILETLGLHQDKPQIISCPTCARSCLDVIKLANLLEEKIQDVSNPVTIAVMGCVVNGPGEARQADIGVCGIQNESDTLMLFKKGKLVKKIKTRDAITEILQEIS